MSLIVLSLVLSATGAPDALGRGHWLVDEENDELLLLRGDGSVERAATCRWPEAVVVTRDGRAVVSCREEGQLAVVDPSGAVRRLDVGHEPKALELDEARRRLYVGLVTGREVLALDLDSLEPVQRAALPYEPNSLALTGEVLVVGSLESPQLCVLDAATLVERWRTGVPATPETFARVTALASVEGDVLVAARLADTGMRARVVVDDPSPGYGGAKAVRPFDVALFMLRAPAAGYRRPEPFVTTGLADLTALAVAGDHIFLASRGERRLSVFSRRGEPLPRLGVAPGGHAIVALSVEETGAFAALDGLRRRALVSPSFGERLSAVALPASRLDAELRLGKELFHSIGDRRVSSRALGCVSCHPDGRDDGLVWRLQGTARQTPMLAAGRLEETGPYNWLGTAPTLEDNLKQTLSQRLMGFGLEPGELRALSRYVREGLRGVRAPVNADARAVERGRELFADSRVGCATCHPPELQLTDGLKHDVASLGEREQPGVPRKLTRSDGAVVDNPVLLGGAYDTPSLIGLSVTAPYFHDGSAETLADVIEKNHDRMGVTSHLSAEERAALVAYLETL